MRRIGHMLNDAVPQSEVLRAARAQSAMRQWADIVGPVLAERSRPDRFQRGTVWVAVVGSAWAQELRMRKDQILQRLVDISGEKDLFTDVRFGVRPLPPPPEPEAPKPVQEDVSQLTIREIAERRLAHWPSDEDGA